MLRHKKRYWTEAIPEMLWPYALKEFSEQLNELKAVDDGITSMEKFSVTKNTLLLKATTHGNFQFMSWIKY